MARFKVLIVVCGLIFRFNFMFWNKYRVVRTSSSDVKEQTFKNSLGGTVGQDKTTAPTFPVDDKKSDNHNHTKESTKTLNFNKTLENDKHRIEVPQRKPRTVRNEAQCLSCFANSGSKTWDCYAGRSVPVIKCADAEHCYIELNPQYIKRGCILPGRVNRTFVCKCPLCNDKPSFDISHYEYKQLSDWKYDNARLQKPLEGMDLICKVCETKGTDPTSDKNCRSGKNADYMVCPNNQLCYTNVDDEIDFVSRGCTDKPTLNSVFFFCNDTACNSAGFPNPTQEKKQRAEAIQLKDDRVINIKKEKEKEKEKEEEKEKEKEKIKGIIAPMSFDSTTCTSDFCSMFMIIISTLIQFV